jgi:DNA-damage-inducible protein D
MDKIKIFETKKVRSHYDSEKEIWYFSVIDVIEVLTDCSVHKRYWSDLKNYLLPTNYCQKI